MENQAGVNESDWFKMPHGNFIRTILIQNGKMWLLIPVMLILIGLVLGIVADYRFAIVGLMAFFILLPLELLFIYLYYGFLETFYFNVTLHKIILDDSEITVSMKWKKIKEIDGIVEEEDFIKSITFKRDTFCKFIVLKDAVVLRAKAEKGFLWLPVAAFEDENQFIGFVNQIIK